jgi:hypothetical protein
LGIASWNCKKEEGKESNSEMKISFHIEFISPL